MNKTPEEYFQEQSFSVPGHNGGQDFSAAELTFIRKYMGLDAPDTLRRIGLSQKAKLIEGAAVKPKEVPAAAPIDSLPFGLEQARPEAVAQEAEPELPPGPKKLLDVLAPAPAETEPAQADARPEDVNAAPAADKAVAEPESATLAVSEEPELKDVSGLMIQDEPSEKTVEPVAEKAQEAASPVMPETAKPLAEVAAKPVVPDAAKPPAPVPTPEARFEAQILAPAAAAAPAGATPVAPATQAVQAGQAAPATQAEPAGQAKPAEAPGQAEESAPADKPAQPAAQADGEKKLSIAEIYEGMDIRAALDHFLRSEPELQMVGFYIGGQEFTVPTVIVQEVIHYSAPTKLPLAPPYVAGAINLRGKVTPLVHLRDILEVNRPRQNEDRFIIICRFQGFQVGLLIERVHTMYQVPQSDIDWGIEAHLGINVDYVSGLLKLNDHLVGIVAVDKIVNNLLQDEQA